MTSPGSPAQAGVAFVAGGSRGLGLLIARELGDRGFTVVVGARDAETLDRAVADLADRGVTAARVLVDVSDHEQVESVVADVEGEHGPIEVLVCVAGVIQVGPLESVQRSHFRQAIDIMLWGPVNTALAVLPQMRSRGRGRIAVITSVGGLVAVPHLLPYSTAKFGAVGFTNGLRAELSGSGITVTTVAPGLMRTGSHVRAQFVGDHGREYAWFAAGASMPVISMDAERAARRIVDGVLRGRSTVILTPLAQLGSRVAAVFPRLTAAGLGLMRRLLPRPPEPPTTPTLEGRQAADLLSPAARVRLGRITAWGDRAARRFGERPGTVQK